MATRERDNQRNRVYAWELNNPIMKPFWNRSLNLTKSEVEKLCFTILRDAGAPTNQIQRFSVNFRQRNGGAEASPSGASFTPSNMPKILVLHEMAHALTWTITDFAGHGANYVSCYLALLERYLGLNILDLANTLRVFIEKEVFKQIYVPVMLYDINTKKYEISRKIHYEKKIKKVRPPEFDAAALKHWRQVFKSI